MKHINIFFLCILIVLSFQTISAQKVDLNRVAELKYTLDTASSDSIKFQTLINLSWIYSSTDTALAFEYIHEMKLFADSTHNEEWKSRYFGQRAIVYYLNDELDKAINILYEKLNFHKSKQNIEGMAESYGDMGSLTLHRNLYWESINYHDTCISLMEEAGLNTYRKIYLKGYVYVKSGNYEFALNNFFKALYGNRELNSKDTAGAIAAIAYTYYKIGEYEKAKSYFEIAEDACITQERHYTYAGLLNDLASMYFDQNQLSKSLETINKSISKWKYIKENVPLANTSDDLGIVEAYVVRSKIFQEMGKNKDALEDINAAIKIAKSSGDREVLVLSYFRLGEFYFSRKEYEPAIKALKLADQFSKGTNLAAKQQDITLQLSQVYAKTKHYEQAYNFLNLSKTLSDSILNEENIRAINRLEYQFEFDLKEQNLICESEQDQQKIELLENDIKLKSKTQLILWGGLIAILIITGLIIIYISNRLKTKSQLAEKQAEINRQKIAELEKAQKLLSMKYMIEGQEKERERLALDLHDDLGSQLAAIKLHLENLDPKHANSLKKTCTQINNAYEDVRRISHNLMPMSLSKEGLPTALEDLGQNISSTKKLYIDIQTIGLEKRLDSTIEVMLFRIIQEAMKNILHHSEANNVILQLINDGSLLALTIEDDGKGFDIKKAEKAQGLGLKSIRTRVEFLNGKIDIKSKKSEGTSLYVEVPFLQKQESHGVG